MAFPIIPRRRSAATGNPASLNLGELAVNTLTGELFLGADGGVTLLNGPVAAGTIPTIFNGNNSATTFAPISGYTSTNASAYLVSVGGLDQRPTIDYTITSANGGSIVFTTAPALNAAISIRAIQSGEGGGTGTGTVTSITAGEGLAGGTITESGTISLAAITTAQTNVGSSTQIPILSINDKGQVTALSTIEFAGLTTAQIAGLSTTAPAALATSAVIGLSTFAARADHQHVFPSASDVGALGATAAAGGDLSGNYPNPVLGAITTAQSNVGSSTVVPVLSVDAKGRVTGLTTAAIASASTSAISSLTGDVTAIGPGAATATLAAITTAQSNVGSATSIPVISIDAKGRVTALSSITPIAASVLVIAGGGGATGAGGGAGGLQAFTLNLTVGQVYTATVGAGGAGAGFSGTAISGTNTSFAYTTTITSIGGGRCGVTGSPSGTAGAPGGSGGGGGANLATGGGVALGGAGTVGQGNNGGSTPGLSGTPCGGGGGAGAVGSNGSTSVGGAGGVGLNSSITGTSTFYAGGGGGSVASGTQGAGGLGGGGTSVGGSGGTGGSGTANTGGGAGGAASLTGTGGNGGSGVVILSVPTANYTGTVTGSPVVTTSGTNTIIKFTSSGTYTA
jgi:hypothetical protein